jgi:HEAT repeat protein
MKKKYILIASLAVVASICGLQVASCESKKELFPLTGNPQPETRNSQPATDSPCTVNPKDIFEAIKKGGINKGDVDKVKELLKKGVDVNAREEPDGMTPLHVAAQYGKLEIVKLLIASGADLEAECQYGTKPIDRASTGEIRDYIWIPPKREKALKKEIEKVARHFKKDPGLFSRRKHVKQMALVEESIVDRNYIPLRLKKTEEVESSLFDADKPVGDGSYSPALTLEHMLGDEDLPLLGLLYAMQDRSCEGVQRLRILMLLRTAPAGRVEKILRKEFESANGTTRLAVLHSLGCSSGKAAADLFTRALEDKEPAIRREGVKWLGSFRVASERVKIEDMLSDKDYSVRLNAAWALGEIGDNASKAALVAALADKSTLALREVLFALSNIGCIVPAKSLAAIIAGHADVTVRKYAVELLSKKISSEAVPVLVKALGDKEESVRLAAAMTLAKIKPSGILDDLMKYTFSEESDRVKRLLYPLVAELGGGDMLPDFLDALKAAKKEIRFQDHVNLLRVLSTHYPEEAVPRLRSIMLRPNDLYRHHAAMFMKNCRSREAVDALIESFGTKDGSLRQWIFDGLVHLTGRRVEYDEEAFFAAGKRIPDDEVEKWRSWWKENREKTDVEKAVASYKTEAQRLIRKGKDMLKNGSLQEAVKCFKQAKFLDPTIGDIFEMIRKSMVPDQSGKKKK